MPSHVTMGTLIAAMGVGTLSADQRGFLLGFSGLLLILSAFFLGVFRPLFVYFYLFTMSLVLIPVSIGQT